MFTSTPVLVVVPASLKGNWRREIGLTTDAKVAIASGTKNKALDGPADCDYLVVNYDILDAWSDMLVGKVAALIVDEAHYLKNSAKKKIKGEWQFTTKRVRVAMDIARALPAGAPIVLLTGTAVTNRNVEFINYIDLLDRWDVFGSHGKFYANFAPKVDQWGTRGSTNGDRMNALARKHFYVRRESEQVLDLPKKRVYTTWLALNGALREYRQMLDEAMRAATKAEQLVYMTAAWKAAGLAKVGAATEWVLNALDGSDEKIVLFAHHVDVQKALIASLEAEGIKVARILAGQQDVEAQKDAFNNGDAQVIVCSIMAAKEGHTLTAARTMVMVQTTMVPAHMMQAEARIWRIGQERECTVVYLAAEDTFEEDILALLDAKRPVVDAANIGQATAEAADETESDVMLRILAGMR